MECAVGLAGVLDEGGRVLAAEAGQRGEGAGASVEVDGDDGGGAGGAGGAADSAVSRRVAGSTSAMRRRAPAARTAWAVKREVRAGDDDFGFGPAVAGQGGAEGEFEGGGAGADADGRGWPQRLWRVRIQRRRPGAEDVLALGVHFGQGGGRCGVRPGAGVGAGRTWRWWAPWAGCEGRRPWGYGVVAD